MMRHTNVVCQELDVAESIRGKARNVQLSLAARQQSRRKAGDHDVANGGVRSTVTPNQPKRNN